MKPPYARARGTPRPGLTDLRRERAIQQMERTGILEEAAKAAGVTRSTLFRWRKEHPEFQEELTEACERKTDRIGRKARDAIEMHLDDVRSRKRIRRTRSGIVQKTGQVKQLREEEPVEMNMAAVRTALTKWDPAWTHPPKDVRDGQGAILTAQLEQIWADMEADVLGVDAAAAAAMANPDAGKP